MMLPRRKRRSVPAACRMKMPTSSGIISGATDR
jgi:hypothetical protein